MAIYCSNCGVELPDGVAFCDACGTPVHGQNANSGATSSAAAPVSPVTNRSNGIGATACPVCGAGALPGEAFCDNCGAALLGPTTYIAPGQASSAPSGVGGAGAPPSYSSAPMGANTNYQQTPAPATAPAHQVTASLVVASPPPPATIQLPNRTELIVGRSDPQSNSYPDVDLGPYGGLDLGVSRRHFRITRNGDQFYLEDLKAMNGCIVNGQRVPPYTLHPLRNGDRILLGKMELLFEAS